LIDFVQHIARSKLSSLGQTSLMGKS